MEWQEHPIHEAFYWPQRKMYQKCTMPWEKVKVSSEGMVFLPSMAKNGIRQLIRCVGTHTEMKCQILLLFQGVPELGVPPPTDRNNHACPPIPKITPSLIFNCKSSWHEGKISSAAKCPDQSRCLPTGMLGAAAHISARGPGRGQRA